MSDETTDSREANTPAASAGELFVVRAGGRLFAVAAEEVEATAENLTPAPLPSAPPAVLGVVSLRGRMRTALDPLRLDAPEAGAESTARPEAETRADPARTDATASAAAPTDDDRPRTDANAPPRLFVALRGDEQLALACDAAEGTLSPAPSDLSPPPPDAHAAVAVFDHRGSHVTVLDPARLFEAAMRGTDRRRRRS